MTANKVQPPVRQPGNDGSATDIGYQHAQWLDSGTSQEVAPGAWDAAITAYLEDTARRTTVLIPEVSSTPAIPTPTEATVAWKPTVTEWEAMQRLPEPPTATSEIEEYPKR